MIENKKIARVLNSTLNRGSPCTCGKNLWKPSGTEVFSYLTRNPPILSCRQDDIFIYYSENFRGIF